MSRICKFNCAKIAYTVVEWDSCSCKVSKVTISKFPLRVLSQDMSTSNMAPVKPEIVIGCVAYCEGTHSQKY